MTRTCRRVKRTTIWAIKDPMKIHGERRRAESTLSVLQPHSNDVILDVGCGEGYQMSFIAKHCQHVVGVDLSLYKLKIGKEKIREADFIRASSEMLPFKTQVFDKVVCLELLEHLKDPSKTLREIDLGLKNKGILIFSVPYRERIVMTRCIHCGKLTPLFGHLHSFDEKKILSILPKNHVLLHSESICTVVASYPLFKSLPFWVWKIIDNLSKLLLGVKPCWFLNKVKKV